MVLRKTRLGVRKKLAIKNHNYCKKNIRKQEISLSVIRKDNRQLLLEKIRGFIVNRKKEHLDKLSQNK